MNDKPLNYENERKLPVFWRIKFHLWTRASSPLADAILDRIVHDSYMINIQSIDPSKDIILLVYWLPKSECRIIPSVFLTFVRIHNGGQICPPSFGT